MKAMKDSGIEWVGEIPQEWEVRRMGQLANEVKNPNVGMREDNLLSLSYGQIKRKSIKSSEGLVPASYETYNIIDCDDIVFRFTDLQNDHKSLRVGRATESGIITSAYVTVRPIQSENSRFMAYAMHSYDFCKGFYGMGSGVRQGLKWQEAKYISIPWPKEDERQRIADYLDQKCIEIYRAVASAEQSIREYNEYKQSLIFQISTKGLKPHAAMKDSGIEWVGEIPQEWEVRRMGQLANEVKNPNVGMREDNLLSLSYGQIKRKSIKSSEGLVPASYETYNIIDCDDIVFRFTDLQNDHKSLRVGRATESGIITSAYVTVRPIQSENSRFMAYAMHSYDFCKGFYGMGSGVRQGLKWQEAKYISIPWPKEDERQRIADYLDQKCIEIDRAIEAKRRIIEELKDYKQSLIFEVVTGKKEVEKC